MTGQGSDSEHEARQPTAADADELALIARSRQGERGAFNALVEHHQAAAYALALRMLGDPDAAADVTQDAFFAAYRAIASFRGTTFRAWLYRIVSNGCYDYWRAQSRRPTQSLDAALDTEHETDAPGQGGEARVAQALIDPTYDPERVALRAEMVERIEEALLHLPAEQRLALILSDIQGLSYDEIARVMGTSLGTVKSRIARGRAHLRTILLRAGEPFHSAQRPDEGHSTQ